MLSFRHDIRVIRVSFLLTCDVREFKLKIA